MKGVSKIAVKLRLIRPSFYGSLVMCNSCLRPTEHVQRIADVIMSFGVIGVNGERFLVAGDGLLVFAQRRQRNTQIVMGLGIVRVDRKRLAVMCENLFRAAKFMKRIAKVVVGFCVSWLDHKRLFIMDDRFVHSTSESNRCPRLFCDSARSGLIAIAFSYLRTASSERPIAVRASAR